MASKMTKAAIEALSAGNPPILRQEQVAEVQAKLAAQKVSNIASGSFAVLPLDNDPEGQANSKDRKLLIVMSDGSSYLATRCIGEGTRGPGNPGVYVYKACDLSTGETQALKESYVATDATEIPENIVAERAGLQRAGQNLGQADGGPCLRKVEEEAKKAAQQAAKEAAEKAEKDPGNEALQKAAVQAANKAQELPTFTACLTVMPFVKGKNLEDTLFQAKQKTVVDSSSTDTLDTLDGYEKPQTPILDGVSKAVDVARELRDLHQRGLVHRDVKPNNIMVSEDGRARLIDFGEALLSADGQPIREDSPPILGEAMGTKHYIPPEVFDAKFGKSAYGAKSDTFSLGMTLADLLIPEVNTKQMEFEYQKLGKFGDEVVKGIQQQVLTILSNKLNSNTSSPAEKEMASLIGRLLSDNPNVRPTMDETIIQLNNALIKHLKANPQEQGKFGDNLISNAEFSKQEAVLHQFSQDPNNLSLFNDNKGFKNEFSHLQDVLKSVNLNENNQDKAKDIVDAMGAFQKQLDKLPANQGEQKRQLQLVLQQIQATPLVQAQMMIDNIQKLIDKHEHKLFASSKDKEMDKEIAGRLVELQSTIRAVQGIGVLSTEKGAATISKKMDGILEYFKFKEKNGEPLKDSDKQELIFLIANLNANLRQITKAAGPAVPTTAASATASNIPAPTTQAPIPQQASIGSMDAAQDSVAVQAAARKPAMLTSFKTVRENNGGEDTLAKRAKVDKENESPNVPPLDLEKVQPAEQEIDAPRGQRPGRQ